MRDNLNAVDDENSDDDKKDNNKDVNNDRRSEEHRRPSSAATNANATGDESPENQEKIAEDFSDFGVSDDEILNQEDEKESSRSVSRHSNKTDGDKDDKVYIDL